jgi:gamma-glutamyltranspeptidase/glutathione hydrolase
VQELGGTMTMEDLRKHKSERVTPISIDYRDCTLYEIPPNGQGILAVKLIYLIVYLRVIIGITALMALGIIDALQRSGRLPPLEQLTPGSPEYLHAIIEALRLAFSDSRWFVTDQEHYKTPVKEMLSKVG